MNNEQLKLACIQEAIKAGIPSHLIVDTAKSYYRFISGKDEVVVVKSRSQKQLKK